MPRVKGGYTTRRRHKKVLKLAKGYYGSKHALYRTAKEQVMRSQAYAYRDRKVRKRDFRKLWIQRINAAAQINGLKYNQFICGLTNANVQINRKMLAEMAVNDAASFANLCEIAKKNLNVVREKENVVTFTKESKADRALRALNSNKVSKETTKPAAKPEVKKAPAKKAEVKEETTTDLTSLTVAQLREIAKSKGVKGYSTLKKAELIEVLSK